MNLMNILSLYILFLGVIRCFCGVLAYFNISDYDTKNLNINRKETVGMRGFGRKQGVWFFSLGVVNIISSFKLEIYSMTLMCLLTYVIGLPAMLNEFLNHKTIKMKYLGPVLFLGLTPLFGLSYHLLLYDFKY